MLASHARTRVGHHGLFFDNLTAPTATTQLPGSATAAQPSATTRGVYLTHNRVYDPRLGRFLQHDPNASGSPTLDQIVLGGNGLLQPSLGVDLGTRLTDRANLFVAYGSSPIASSDPTGLFIQLLAPTSTLDVYMDYNEQVLDASASIKDVFGAYVEQYGWNQLDAIDAALDWSTPDRVFSAGTQIAGLVVVAGKIGETHHIIPRFLLGLDNAANRLKLPQSEHARFHRILENEFRRLGLDPPNSKGLKNWRQRLSGPPGSVSQKDIEKIRTALIKAGRQFDTETKDAFKLARKIQHNLDIENYAKGALKLRRRR